jgi:hypothetical protein
MITTSYHLTPLEEALRLASHGLKIIPLHAPVEDGCTCGQNCGKSAGKHPLWTNWISKATDDPDEIRRIWQAHPLANVGVPMGKENGTFALDVDGTEGMETLQTWIGIYGDLPATWQVHTGGGGIQLWYRMPEGMDVPNSVKKMGKNIDLRGTGGQSVAPGSLHRSGKRYQWAPGRSPSEIPLADPPSWLIQKIQAIMKEQSTTLFDSNRISIDFDSEKLPDELMKKAIELTEQSKAFREVTLQQRSFPSASERDQSIANIAAIHGWSDQDICDFLIHYRKVQGEDLKHGRYYQLTIAKARQWAEENKQETILSEMESEVDPMPLPQPPAVEPFPAEVFPEPIYRFLKAVSASLGLPTDYPGLHVLTFLGTAIGNSRMIELKPGYRQQPNLYTCMVADTGAGKSPAQDQAFAPLLAFQNKYYQIFQKQMEEYESAYRQYQIEMSEWKKEKSKDKDLPQEPEKPNMKELYITQATMEALLRALKNNDRGLVLKADELSGWIRGMNQYKGGKGDDREQYLSLWSGTDIKINRVRNDGEPLFIPKPFFAVTGNIPPDIVPTLEDEQGYEDGFIHRILFSYPDAQNPSRWTWTGITDEAVQGYTDVLERLYQLERVDGKPKILSLTNEAKKWWEEWYDIHIREMTDPDFPRKLRGPWAKMPNQMARIALIIHMVRVVCGEATEEEVDEISITRAGEVVKYFKSHARKVYLHLKKTEADKRIEEAVEWIRKRGGVARKRDIQMYKVADCKKASDVKTLFETLQDFGYGKIRKVAPGRGRPTIEFVLFDQKKELC